MNESNAERTEQGNPRTRHYATEQTKHIVLIGGVIFLVLCVLLLGASFLLTDSIDESGLNLYFTFSHDYFVDILLMATSIEIPSAF